MHSMKLYFLLASFLLLAQASVSASDNRNQNGKDLIDAAVEKTDIFALPHFVLKADLHIKGDKGTYDGAYALQWNGPEQWREEISVPGYFEVQVGSKGVLYIKRSVDFRPLRIDQLHRTLGYGSSADLGSFIQVVPRADETIKKVYERKEHGIKVQCVEIVDHEKHVREVCVDASTGTLVRREPFFDKDTEPIGTKVFPRFLSYVEEGSTVVEIQITEFKTMEQLPSANFVPPQGSLSRPGCLNPTSSRLVHRATPQYPELDRQRHTQGKVSLYALITKDGSPQNLRTISGVSPSLNQATIDAVKQWRYEPATCNGAAVDSETVITVDYSLSFR